MRTEKISRDKQRKSCDAFDPHALSALMLGPQGVLLKEWLKNSSQKRTWKTLLEVAGTQRIELAESLAQALAACGAATLEERFQHTAWIPVSLIWKDYELLCATLGLKTQTARRDEFTAAWEAAAQVDWQRAELADAYREILSMPADKGQSRLLLLVKLNDWLQERQSGTRRQFALFARGQTKQISRAEWAWLEEITNLTECGIERHAPALWIAGDVQLLIGQRWLDVGAAGDFLALTPQTMSKVAAGRTGAIHYRLIENRTSFENVARAAMANSDEIVLWLPGYMPDWWRIAVGMLLDAMPLPARISCDADPDGVQIALQASKLWKVRNLTWEPHSMAAEDADRARHKLPLTEHDIRLANMLLSDGELPAMLETLLQWCIDHQCKAEQENWL